VVIADMVGVVDSEAVRFDGCGPDEADGDGLFGIFMQKDFWMKAYKRTEV